MVVLNYTGGEINAKIVYYGPGLSGKTTNLEYIHEKTPAGARGKMVSMKTQTDRTLFFDFLPLELGEIGGYRTRFLLYTVPGQVYYNATRKLVLKGVDAVVFVADSSRAKLEENLESLRNLEQNLNEHGLSLDELPWVIQYNKRDAADALPVRDLDARLNPLRVETFEAVATRGTGVYETFHGIATLMYRVLKERLEQGEFDADRHPARTDAAPAPAPAWAKAPEAPAPAGGLPAENEIEFDSAIDSMLREVDTPAHAAPAPVPAASARPQARVVAAAPPAPTGEAAVAPTPVPRAELVMASTTAAPGAAAPDHPVRPELPGDGRGRPAAAGGADGALPPAGRVNAPLNDNDARSAAQRRETASSDDRLFEAVHNTPFDLELGRLPMLDEAAVASDTARDEGPHEFVTDPMRRPTRPEAPAPAAVRAPVTPVAAEREPIAIPVVLSRAHFAAGLPVRVVLEIRLKDD